MQAGRLDRMIDIIRQTITQDAAGESVATEVTLATVHAQRLEQRPGQLFTGASDTPVNTIIWRVRWRTDVRQADIIAHAGERFEITALREIGRRQGLDIVTERAGANV